ncbi:MAG: DUF4258 domain-containing protein [Thermodesulfobacteriota bacterium]|nr:DUF4258 domain-containing protein [Thermodesulfobacteriota bacterium]
MIKLTEISDSFESGSVRWRKHALERMLERGILRRDVREIVLNGEIIEQYPASAPYPGVLVHGIVSGRNLHVVISWNDKSKLAYVISAYEPDEIHFMPDMKTRRGER